MKGEPDVRTQSTVPHRMAYILIACMVIALLVVQWAGMFPGRGYPLRALAGKQELTAGAIDPHTGKKIKYWVAPMDPAYIRNEPGKSPMGMDLVPVYEEAEGEKEPTSTIRIDPVTIQNMGVRLDRVTRKSLIKNIRTLGTITFDETRMYSINTKFSGWIEKLYVNFIGETVRKGQPLFDIYSPDLVTAQEEYLLAFNQFRNFSTSSYACIRDSCLRLLDASRTRLKYWDLSDRQIRQLEQRGTVKKTLTIFSSASGIVIKKTALEGHFVKAGEDQYEIADLSHVWVDVDVYEYELPWIEKGMEAEMELAYIPGKRFAGRVLYIYPFLATKTRTARVRLQFTNPEGELKPGMYANVILKSIISRATLVIPHEAVIDSGVRKVVFVSRGKGKFESREVRIGAEGSNYEFEVLEGLQEGEEIVVSAQFMLDSESRLREAIQKMLEIRQQPSPRDEGDDMNLSGETMGTPPTPEEDLDLSDVTMDDPPGSSDEIK
jgi:multidrug efflux pump subunit AcrA (membrane-fusion protein)